MLSGLIKAVTKCFGNKQYLFNTFNNTLFVLCNKITLSKSIFIQVISVSINAGYLPYRLIFVICIIQIFIISASPPNDQKVVIGRKLEVVHIEIAQTYFILLLSFLIFHFNRYFFKKILSFKKIHH